MGRLTKERVSELVDIRDNEGVLACINRAGMHAEAILVCEGLDYNYYIGEAKAIQMELEKGFVDLSYLDEKIRHIEQFSKIVENRRAGKPSWG